MAEQLLKTKRQEWMQVLARAAHELQQFKADIEPLVYSHIRSPEVGMVMMRGRAGGSGQAFNVGEVAVTRCVVKLASGEMGYSYVLGRDLKSAEIAAVMDGLLQGDQAEHWFERVIAPLQQQQLVQQAARNNEVMGSKVNFFTMVRGD